MNGGFELLNGGNSMIIGGEKMQFTSEKWPFLHKYTVQNADFWKNWWGSVFCWRGFARVLRGVFGGVFGEVFGEVKVAGCDGVLARGFWRRERR